MRKLIARVFDYSLDGLIATEGTEFYQYCRDLPDDPAEDARGAEFYAGADMHIMGRAAYESMASYFPTATDDPNAEALNAARKVVFSHTLDTADWANTTIASGDVAEEVDKLRRGGDGYIVVRWRFRRENTSDLLTLGAGEGNRTPMTSLEGWGSAIELRPRG
jgi:dihydrofolate reductase